MEVVVIFNGLGNQMSQYAFYIAKKKRNKKCSFIFDPESKNRHNGSELENVFGITYEHTFHIKLITLIYNLINKNKIFSILLYLIGIRIIREPYNYDFSERYLKKRKGLLNYYFGGWHSEQYFYDIRDEIINTFKFKDNSQDRLFIDLKSAICVSNSVSIHIRRGDYLIKNKNSIYQYHGICTDSYYDKAIFKMQQLVDNPIFFIFSNDIDWCKTKFRDDNFVFVDCNTGTNSWRDIYLMSLCKYHINANSSFSWWGAWLCQYNNNITICPEKFLTNIPTKDFYPNRWIKISSN